MSRIRYFVLARFIAIAATLAVIVLAPAHADSGKWRIDLQGKGARAALPSTNSLSMGGNRTIEYHPNLIVGCIAGQKDGWTETVRLRESIAAASALSVTVQIDGQTSRNEEWALQDNSSTLVFSGNGAVRRLAGARRLKIRWREGYFAGGEANFSLAGIDDVLTQLSGACGLADDRQG